MRKTLDESLSTDLTGTGKHYSAGSYSGPRRGRFGVSGFANALRRAKGSVHNVETKNLSRKDLEFFQKTVEPHLKKASLHASGLGRMTMRKIRHDLWKGVREDQITKADYRDFKKMARGFETHREDTHHEALSSSRLESDLRISPGDINDSTNTDVQKDSNSSPEGVYANIQNIGAASSQNIHMTRSSQDTNEPILTNTLGTQITGVGQTTDDKEFEKIKKASEDLPDMDIG